MLQLLVRRKLSGNIRVTYNLFFAMPNIMKIANPLTLARPRRYALPPEAGERGSYFVTRSKYR